MKITCFKIVNTGKINKTIQTRLCHKIFILNPQTLHLNDNLLLFQNIYFHVTIFIYFHNIYIYILYCTSLQVTVYFPALHLRFTKFGYNCCRSTDIRFYRFWEPNFLPVEKYFQLNRIFEDSQSFELTRLNNAWDWNQGLTSVSHAFKFGGKSETFSIWTPINIKINFNLRT